MVRSRFRSLERIRDEDLWAKENEKKFPEWLRWVMFAALLGLIAICIIGEIRG
jgi:hypothetical protein